MNYILNYAAKWIIFQVKNDFKNLICRIKSKKGPNKTPQKKYFKLITNFNFIDIPRSFTAGAPLQGASQTGVEPRALNEVPGF